MQQHTHTHSDTRGQRPDLTDFSLHDERKEGKHFEMRKRKQKAHGEGKDDG